MALGIMAIEWALFLLLAWYLEQVLPSGRHLRAFQNAQKEPAFQALAMIAMLSGIWVTLDFLHRTRQFSCSSCGHDMRPKQPETIIAVSTVFLAPAA